MESSRSAVGLNFFDADVPLVSLLKRRIPDGVWPWAESRLRQWGELCGGPIAGRAELIDKNPPRLERHDRWGREINAVVHHAEALATKRDLCEAGYTGFAWTAEVRDDPDRRKAASMMGTTFSYMLNQSDTGMACACGMTGGVARLVDRFAQPEVREEFMPHLTSMRFDDLWDGAMFMTERSGGSDLSGTATIAHKRGETWELEGEKWFCSNIDARAIMTLARPEGGTEGTRGLALFLVPSRLDDGSPNKLRIRRIKDKLGTRSVPTGEVLFEGALAYQIGQEGIGLPRMMDMVNLSRLGVATMGAGIARRSTLEAALYAEERVAFGKRLKDHPMVRETIVDMQVEAEAALLMCIESASLAGRFEIDASDDEKKFLRILTPLAKIRAARTGLDNAIQAVEVLGGNGYIEDWPTARQLRDAQCHTIWEGTENINSLDVLRAMVKQGAHEGLFARIEQVLQTAPGPEGETLAYARDEAIQAMPSVSQAPEVHARRFANYLCDMVASGLLIEEAARDTSERSALIARRYVDRHLRNLPPFKNGQEAIHDAYELVVPIPS
jgi:alkylation response protein AidB-like acyl-CoA dehydrogenase